LRRRLAALAALPLLLLASAAYAADSAPSDPIGDLIMGVVTGSLPGSADFKLKASLYHAGARGVGVFDSLGCRVVAMRTAAVDVSLIPKRTLLFIKETVGLQMPDGSIHDGYWYASDTGGAIKGPRIDLFTGMSARTMGAMRPLNLSQLTVVKAGEFKGCPPAR
jgi:3D (Asp-Asp-Asp) domain-containing protein